MYGKVICKVMQKLDERSGVSKSTGKPWKSVSYLLEMGGNRPYSFVANRMMQEGELELPLNTLQNLTVKVEARPYQNKWYNDVKIVKVGGDDEML